MNRFISLIAPVFWLIIYVTQLTCLKVKFVTYKLRVSITHRAHMELK